MSNKLISIIIPVKNGENYLHEAIEGIKKQEMNIEIIVVDDGSEDNTAEIAKKMGCTVIKHEKTKGFVVGKNTGLQNAKGEFVMFHDHDDIMNDGVLKQLYDTFDTDTQVVMAKVKDFISPDCSDNTIIIKQDAYYGLFTGAVLIRKQLFDRIGSFDDNLLAGEMLDFNNKLNTQNIKIKKIDFVSTNRRIHNSNFGLTNKKTEFQDYAKVLRAKLARK